MTLTRQATRIKLQDLPFRLLLMLVENPGEIISREDLRKGLWPENTFVEFDNNLGVAVRKIREALGDNPDAPHYVATIPRRGYQFVAPVQVEFPEAGSPVPLKSPETDLAGSDLPGDASITPAHVGLRSRWFWVLGILFLVGAAVLVEVRFRPARASSPVKVASVPVPIRRSVAVLGFRNLNGRATDQWLSTVFTETLNTELGVSTDLRMVSGEDMTLAKRELPIEDEDSLGKSSLNRLKTKSGADIVLLGSYLSVAHGAERRLRLDLRLQDTTSGEIIAEDAVTGTENDILAMTARAGTLLRERLGVKSRPDLDSTLKAALPVNQTAARLYAEGRAKLWAFDMLGARDLLSKAVAADPDFPLGHSALSEALWHLGYQVKARAEAKQALDLASGLPKEDRLLIEGQYWRASADWPKTIDTYKSLFDLYPDNIDYGLLLASAQLHVDAAASLATLNRLHHLPAPQGQDPRIDMAEASAWILTDNSKARAAADRAIAKATADGSNALVGWTRGILCQQGPSTGAQLQETIQECEDARKSSLAVGDRNGAAMMLVDQAAMYYQQGAVLQSQAMFRSAIEEFRKVGNLDGEVTARSNLADTLMTAGKLEEAKKLWLAALGEYLAIQDKSGAALNLNNLGDLARQSGNLDAAEVNYRKAQAIAEEIQDKDALGYIFSGMGDVAMDRGSTGEAQRDYDKSLALRRQIGEKESAGAVSIGLAMADVEEGHAAKAETALRQLMDEFSAEHESDDQLTAAIGLINAYLSEGRQADAEREVQASASLAVHSQSLFLKEEFRLCSARAVLASAHPDNAKPLLDRLLSDARRGGYVGLQLEARLLLVEWKRLSSHGSQASTELGDIEQEANRRGYALVARRAAMAKARLTAK